MKPSVVGKDMNSATKLPRYKAIYKPERLGYPVFRSEANMKTQVIKENKKTVLVSVTGKNYSVKVLVSKEWVQNNGLTIEQAAVQHAKEKAIKIDS